MGLKKSEKEDKKGKKDNKKKAQAKPPKNKADEESKSGKKSNVYDDISAEFKTKKSPEAIEKAWVYISALIVAGVLILLALIGVDVQLSGLIHMGRYQFVMLMVLGLLGPIGFYERGRAMRMQAIEERLSDFLRDIAESGRAGQTLHHAIITSSRGNYGALTDDIKKMSIQISWGVNSTEVLDRFAKRVDTPLVNRAVVLINQASAAGGDVSKVLEAAANDTKEMQLLQAEREIQMGMYVIVIFVSFVVFLVVILIVFSTFVPKMEDMKEDMLEAQRRGEETSLAGGFDPTGVDFDEIRLVFMLSGLVQGVGDGLVAGLMGTGRIFDGLRHGFVMVLIVFIIFSLAMPV